MSLPAAVKSRHSAEKVSRGFVQKPVPKKQPILKLCVSLWDADSGEAKCIYLTIVSRQLFSLY